MATEINIELDCRGERFQKAEQGPLKFAQRTGNMADKAAPPWQGHCAGTSTTCRGPWRRGTWPGGTTQDTLSRRSGNLMQSIKDSISVKGNTLETNRGTIGTTSDIGYGPVQEFGATITPKSAKYLAIPLEAALDGNGILLQLSPRQWDNTFVAKGKAGNLIISSDGAGR